MRSSHTPISPHTLTPLIQLLSNGRYQVMVSNAGAGYSHWKNSALTRWREDFSRDNWGSFLYLRDLSSGEFWSSTFQPTCVSPQAYSAFFSANLATFESRVSGVRTTTDIVVAADDDVELRRITITNDLHVPVSMDLTSYAEVVLAPAATDDAHPAFSKLFVQTEILDDRQAILCHRRPGGDAQAQPWLFQMLVSDESQTNSYETDRARFIGRNQSTARPQAMDNRAALSGTDGSVLDPIAAIRCPFSLDSQASITFTYVMGVADSREVCLLLMNKYRTQYLVDDCYEAAAHAYADHDQNRAISTEQIERYSRIADSIVYGNLALRANADVLLENRRGQSGLWGFSISGDVPIVVLQLSAMPDMDDIRDLLRAHEYWRSRGLAVDLVFCKVPGLTYAQSIQEQITALIAADQRDKPTDRIGAVFVLLQDLSSIDHTLLLAVARVVLDQRVGALTEQLARVDAAVATPLPRLRAAPDTFESARDAPACADPVQPLQCANGLGGFSANGQEYVITLNSGQSTPAPWVNILANAQFGTMVSESGSANTWSENAHEFLLTPWSNDPVGDAGGEAYYLRDEDSGDFWSPTPWPTRGSGRYACRHGFGYSVFTHTQAGIDSELTMYVARDAAVKFIVLKIRNQSSRPRRLSTTAYVEWVLGDLRTKTMTHIHTRMNSNKGAFIACNPYNADFGERKAFFATDETGYSWTADRTEFLGRNGAPDNPAAMIVKDLGGVAGAGLDPCAAIRVTFDLAVGGEREIVFKLGAGRDDDEVAALLARYAGTAAAQAALSHVTAYWQQTLGAVSIETPDRALDLLANGWLLYQVLASRLWGRTAFYQSSGAFGFRDQLQDVMALVHGQAQLVRKHLLLCASRQYVQGDVQHWWHPPVGRGVRTRCSDDYLWLPLASCRYITTTGDTGVLDEWVPYLIGRPLDPGEASYYELPGQADEPGTLYEHCVRAIENGLHFGTHGLPLMGTGDWNDGMNMVGAQGKGESIWLAFFLYHVLTQFSEIARTHGDTTFAIRCTEQASLLDRQLDAHGWDGAWFKRAYFDDGSVLGSAQNSECQIDSIAQSWSVLANAPTQQGRQSLAMQSVDDMLVDREGAVIKLLAPAFDTSVPDPGYIKAYVPGVRENGGQYTHAAVWSVMAFAALGERERAWELLSLINPLNHAADREAMRRYKVEPYVVASDVYALSPHTGRGGWTWYSGSAGWMYRLVLESVLGLRRLADKLYIEPCIPSKWESFKISYRFGESTYAILVRQGAYVRSQVLVDGVAQTDAAMMLIDDGLTHEVQVYVPRQNNKAEA
ncbi:hypothetical protein KVP09_11985 [Alcaligenaceae bacterium CGII-47]|nr:hypothetical protein [Alcaligenaceae bacterium CGII-47]